MLYKNRLATLLLVFLLLLTMPCLAANAPKNIIFFIGDGMGVGQVTGTHYESATMGRTLVLNSMPITGFLLTNSLNGLVTDSAAGGTALATGYKTNNGMISMCPEGKSLQTVLEVARERGKSTGIVTTDSVTGATPATFYAHVKNRGQQEDIAGQLVASRVNVALGMGGTNRFVPKTEGQDGREDGRDLTADAKKRGYDVALTLDEMKASSSDRILGLFAGENVPTLEEMTTKAIALLSKNPRGFFLMNESSRIDGGGHGNDQVRVVNGTLELDDALRAALEFAKADGNTLIVVTADHETGGMAIQNPNEDHPTFCSKWTSKGHSANMVPIYAYGPGAELFTGTRDNTYIGETLRKLSRN